MIQIHSEGMRPYQPSMVDTMITQERRRLLILRYGTGKTWTILRTLSVGLSKAPKAAESRLAAIVLCRNRNLDTWKDEIKKRSPNGRAITIHEYMAASSKKGNPTVMDSNTVLLVPHHLMRVPLKSRIVDTLVSQHKPYAIICDESTKIKNPKAKQTEAILELADLHSKEVSYGERFAMTGFATPEGPHEIWSQLQFSHPFSNPLGASYYSMLSTYFMRSDRGYVLRNDRRERFMEICSYFIARMSKEQWLHHLSTHKITVTYAVEHYDESVEQADLLDSLEQNWSLEHSEGVDEYSYTMQIHAKAQQIANGFYKTADGAIQRLEANPKVRLLIELLNELFEEVRGDRQIVVWCHYIEDYEIVSEALEEAGLSFCVGPDNDQLKRFENGHARIILMPVTISEGFNELAVADVAIFFSNVYSIETRNQAEHRLIRLNQKSPVVSFIDLCGRRSYDKLIVEALQTKQPVPNTPRKKSPNASA